jgi:carboxylesterase
MPARASRVARAYLIWSAFAKYLRGRGEGSIRDPEELAKSRSYGFMTARLLRELRQVMELARRAAPMLRAPTLMIQSRDDNRIEPKSAAETFQVIASSEKELVWTNGNGHVITVDRGREAVFERIGEWLRAHVSR